ncbi:MAG: hypothetical protein JWO07_607, partial [Candidatus Saccharibacteria bacterium]|nr:hypothetical protein [Candidatus Saccharibacteria bacterium]
MITQKLHKYLHLSGAKFLIALLLVMASVATTLILQTGGSSVVHAVGSCHGGNDAQWTSTNGQKSCVIQNCDSISSRMDTGQCVDAIRNCQSAGLGVSNADSNPNWAGSCSNAVASCATVEIDISSCSDGSVLNKIKDCNLGDVGAGGSCGVDSAAGDKSNVKTAFNRALDGSNSCASQYKTDPDAEQKCKNAYVSTWAKCYQLNSSSPQGSVTVGDIGIPGLGVSLPGTGSTYTGPVSPVMGQNFTDSQFQECMEKNANDPDVCKHYGGNFTPDPNDSTKGTCAAPPPPAPPTCPTPANPPNTAPDAQGNCPDGSNIDQAKGPGGNITQITNQCGEARVNLLACGTAQGAPALNAILKIIIFVLSIIIGIASVGGLA